MLAEILDALAKPIREGALSSLRSGPSGGVVAQIEATVSQYDALRGTRAQPSSPASTSASATGSTSSSSTSSTTRPKRAPLAYELELDRMCADDVRERVKPAAAEQPVSEPGQRKTGSIRFERPDPGLVALLEEIDRLDTLGLSSCLRPAARRAREREPINSAGVGSTDAHHAEPLARVDSAPRDTPTACELSPFDRRRLARARMLRRRRVLALARSLRRRRVPAEAPDDRPAIEEAPARVGTPTARQPFARGPPG